jgi:hypothetical protein
MYFPWVGMLEQIRLADVFVHYDDVQFSKGSFTNRVQVKLPPENISWMTVPLKDLSLGQRIDAVQIRDTCAWKHKHLAMLQASFAKAPFRRDALGLAESVLDRTHNSIAELSRDSMLTLADYFGLSLTTRFIDSKALAINGHGSQRVFDIVKHLKGDRYVTGQGALHYLDHELFEQGRVEVAYMDYECRPYAQSHGLFTPYVSALDLVAHVGRSGIEFMTSKAIYWRDFNNGSSSQISTRSGREHSQPCS